MSSAIDKLRASIRDVPDFPKPGIVFKDITTLLQEPAMFRAAIDLLADEVAPLRPEKIVAVESRGFILGGALADRLRTGFVPVRKPGKLPYQRVAREYALEYGTDRIEMHQDALARGERVVVVDDVLATGGTARATGELVEGLGARLLGFAFLIELAFLSGRDKLAGHVVKSLIVY